MSATGVLLWYSAALSLSGESRSRQQPSLASAASSNRDAQNRGSLITSFDVSEIIDITPGISQVLPSSFYSFLCWGLVQMLSSEFEPLAVPVSIWKAVSECWDSCETVLRQLSEGGERVCVCVCESNGEHLASAFITLASGQTFVHSLYQLLFFWVELNWSALSFKHRLDGETDSVSSLFYHAEML